MARRAIVEAKSVGNFTVELLFGDNTKQRINVGEFIQNHPHPQYDKYLNEEEFGKFSIDDGNIVWGEDWDLVFPVEELYAGRIA